MCSRYAVRRRKRNWLSLFPLLLYSLLSFFLDFIFHLVHLPTFLFFATFFLPRFLVAFSSRTVFFYLFSLSLSPSLPPSFSLLRLFFHLLFLSVIHMFLFFTSAFFFLIFDSVSLFLFHEPCSTFVSPLLVPVSVSLFAPRFLCFFLHTHACPWHVCRISTSFPRSSVSVPLSPGFLWLFLRLVSLSSSLFFLLPAAVSFLRPIYPPRIPLSSSVPLLRRGYACVWYQLSLYPRNVVLPYFRLFFSSRTEHARCLAGNKANV